jgi:murein peptide amidase A
MDKGRSIRFVCTAILAVVSLSGCYEPEPGPRIIGVDRAVEMPAIEAVPRFRMLGRSVQGRPILAQVLGDGADTTLFIATIHGNEAVGTPLMGLLADHLTGHPELLKGRRVVVMAVANPDGMAARTRENIRGVDLNRNFEAGNRINNRTNGLGALSEPESKAIHAAIAEFSPDRIITLHQPLNCIDYDGPAKALATQMATHCHLPVKKLGARPGSLGSYTGEELKIPTITMEFPAAASQLGEQALWNRYGQAVVAAIKYPQHVSK